jgi:ATP citrate (pro-S)-lyase
MVYKRIKIHSRVASRLSQNSLVECKGFYFSLVGKHSAHAITGVLDHLIVEPFLPHEQTDEYYVCIQSEREGEETLFFSRGGVDVGDVDANGKRLFVAMHCRIDYDSVSVSSTSLESKLLE